MSIGFQNFELNVQTSDGLDDIFMGPLDFVTADGRYLRAPTGSTTDGLSTPLLIRNIPGFTPTGRRWWSGGMHDSGYRDFLQVWSPEKQDWLPAHYSQSQCDHMILEMMEFQDGQVLANIDSFIEWAAKAFGYWLTRTVTYHALRLFGWYSFRQDRRDAAERLINV